MKQYIVDAFTDKIFHGNQAAVCILGNWLPEDMMMNITRENNFSTMSGDLFIGRDDRYIVMDFPAYRLNPVPVADEMTEAFGARPLEAYIDRDLLLVFDSEDTVRTMQPDFEKVKALPGEGVGVTARGREYDCVSRFFDPKLKVNEDPVTGSVHCMIAPYWTDKLHKNEIRAYQASERGGEMRCTFKNGRVVIAGEAVLFSESELNLQIRI